MSKIGIAKVSAALMSICMLAMPAYASGPEAIAREAVMTGTPDPMVSNYSKRHLWQLLRLNWLAPDIVAASQLRRSSCQR